MESVRAARVRGRIEAGAALAILVEDELHKEAGYASLDEYATTVLHMDRTAVYEFIKDGNASPWWPRSARRRTGPCCPHRLRSWHRSWRHTGRTRPEQCWRGRRRPAERSPSRPLKAAAQELELEVTTAEKSPAPRRSAPAPLDILEAGLLALRDVRSALDRTAFRAGWDAAAAGGVADAERLE